MPSALRANLRLFYFIPEKIVLESLIFPDRATHRPSLAGATCPSPFGQVGNIFTFCGEPRGAVYGNLIACFQVSHDSEFHVSA